ncbi:MAG: helix-turn-helix domain-containing protein [Sporomusaceae bacterium]|nr:helix-turn-helix domain-containing protein [Sporomusaceae bacterium]
MANLLKPITAIHIKLFYVFEVAAMLRVSTQVVYILIHNGKLPAIKMGRSWKIPEESINSYINSLQASSSACQK